MKIATFEIDFGLGVLDTFRGQFYDCLIYVEDNLSYSGRSVDIWSERGNRLACLTWCPLPRYMTDKCIADYGAFGHYAQWVLNPDNYSTYIFSKSVRFIDKGSINAIYLSDLDDTCTCYDLHCVCGVYSFIYRGVCYLTNSDGEGLFIDNYTHQIVGTCDFSLYGKSMPKARAYINRWLNHHCLEV